MIREQKGQRSGKDLRTLASGGAISLVGSMAGRVLGFILQVLMARKLGPAAYGVYALALAIVGLTQNISTLGIPRSMLRFVAGSYETGNRRNYKKTIRLSFNLILVLTLLFAAVVIGFRGFLLHGFVKDQMTMAVVTTMLLSLPFYGIWLWGTSLANALKRMKETILIREIGAPFFRIVLIGSVILFSGDLLNISFAYLASFVALVLFMFVILGPIFKEADEKLACQLNDNYTELDKNINVFSIMRVSVPLFLSSFAFIAILYTDRIMLGYIVGTKQVGIYNAASVLSIHLSFILMAINRIFAPLIASKYVSREVESMQLLFRKATWWSFLLTLPIFLVILFNSKLIMSIYGTEFINGWMVLSVLAIGQMFNVSTGPVGVVLQMTGKHDLDFIGNLVLLTINIGLNIIFIPPFGVLGAAFATVASVTSVMVLRIYLVYRHLNILPFSGQHLIPVLTVLPLATIALLMNLKGIDYFSTILGSFAFLLLLFLLLRRTIDSQDIDFLNYFFGRKSKYGVLRAKAGRDDMQK